MKLHSPIKCEKANSDQYENLNMNINMSSNVNPNLNSNDLNPKLEKLRRIKRQKKKNSADYKKNICGYITKKVLR
jgi:hypothetical protein